MSFASFPFWPRAFAGALVLGLAAIGATALADNANPTVTFTTNTNQTNPSGRWFQLQLFSVTNFTNLTTTSYTNVKSPAVTTTNTNNGIVVTNTVVTNTVTSRYTNDFVFITGVLQNLGGGSTNLVTNGLVFSPSTGLLSGVPTTNFILALTNSDLRVLITNQITVRTNIQTNILTTINSNGYVYSNYVNIYFTNTYLTNLVANQAYNSANTYRLVFQSPAQITNYPITNMVATNTTDLPITNGLGLQYGYQLVSGQGVLTNTNGTNYLTSTGMQPVVLRVSLAPTNDGLQIWSSNSTNITISKIDPAIIGFGFATNTNLAVYTRTNLTFGSNTPLLVTNAALYSPVFTANPTAFGQIFYSNHPTIPTLRIPYFKALAGTGNVIVTATVPGTNASLVITQSLAPAPTITMLGVFSNGAYTNTNPAVTAVSLQAYSSAGYGVGFSSANSNIARITNGNTLVMVGNGTCNIVASNLFLNTNNYSNAVPITNTLKVQWTSGAPTFTSTNRQDGVQGVPFTYFLLAGPNTNAFPITYGATNLAPGLVFVAPNKIVGTPTNAGLFRMQLTASNAGGVTTNVLTSTFAPAATNSVTNPWSYQVALGTGTNTNGKYNFPLGLPSGIGSVTNSNSSAPPILVLSNANTNPASGVWFAGITNLSVIFSNSQTNLTSSVSLNVRPVAPTLSLASPVTGSPSLTLAVTGAVSPAGLTNVAGYPVLFFSSNLPTGLTLGTNGVVTGTPKVSGVRTAQLWASNAVGTSTRTNVMFVISNVAGVPCEIPMAPLFPGASGAYASSNLPPGLQLNPYSGLIEGIPLAVGNLSWTVTLATRTANLTNSTNAYFGPPMPQLVLPASWPEGRVGQPYLLQPSVTGAGWSWAGADPLDQTYTNIGWESRMVFSNGISGRMTNTISSNSNGTILATTNGLTLSNTSSPGTNTLALMWGASLPSSWPWQATLRLRIAGLSNSINGVAGPFLNVFRAQSPFGTNYLDRYAEAYLDAYLSTGNNPGASWVGTNGSSTVGLPTVGTNEIAVRLSYDTNGSRVVMAVNSNPAANWPAFANVLTNTNLTSAWNLTNVVSAMRLWVGFSAMNQGVIPGQALARGFALIPGGVVFSASNLPPGLSIDSNSGTIYGTPTTITNVAVVITVSNVSGVSSKTNSIIILP